MLQDYLVKDLGDLEITEGDRKSLYGIQSHKGIQMLLKFCLGNVMNIESRLFGKEGDDLDLSGIHRLRGQRSAYYELAKLMATPPREETQDG